MKKIVLAVLFTFALSSVAFASPLTDYSKGKAALDINYRVSPDYNVDSKFGDFNLKEEAKNIGLPTNFDGDSNVEWGFTYGIGNNWALQYRQATPKGQLKLIDHTGTNYEIPDYQMVSRISANETSTPIQSILDELPLSSANVNIESKTRVEEYNVMYKMDKNFSLFTGIVRATPSAKVNAGAEAYWGDAYSGNVGFQGHDKNIWQFGFVAVKPLNKDLTSYGIASLGSDYRNWEIGLGYKIAKDLEFNVNYRDMKIDDMKVANVSFTEGSYGMAKQANHTQKQSYDLKNDTTIKGWGFGITYIF
ncbi:hypothetical protein SDC9_13699 [bioreactor metagenome]|uniref:Uncharacterized protein n=1 Tax=bioreactor metagenome TaxID=1076179 RepID=A0A644TLZ6_9ZZZZ|nr:hypothetical protein [Negativicutes bacterium]